MVRKSRKNRKIRVIKRIAFWGIIVFISCTGMYFYRKYKDIQLQNIVSHTTENESIEGRLQKMSHYYYNGMKDGAIKIMEIAC